MIEIDKGGQKKEKIQPVISVYGKDGKSCVDALFDDKDKPLFDIEQVKVEVPTGMRKEAIEALRKKIESHYVPSVVDAKFANEVIVEGLVTYETAYNIAMTGKIEGLHMIFINNLPYTMMQSSITAIIVYAASIWQGDSQVEALTKATGAFLATLATGMVTQMAMDVIKQTWGREVTKPIANAMTQGLTKGLGEQTIINIGKWLNQGQQVTLSVAQTLITELLITVTMSGVLNLVLTGGVIVITTIPDVYRLAINGISPQQFIKNLTINTVSMTTGAVVGTAGGFGGAALGSLAGPAGTIVGGIVGGMVAGTGAGVASHLVSKKIGDIICKDDAIKMFEILQLEFPKCAVDYHLTKDETHQLIEIVIKKSTSKLRKKLTAMYRHGASGKAKEDKMNLWTHYAYVHIIEPLIWSHILPNRQPISYEELQDAKEMVGTIQIQSTEHSHLAEEKVE